MREAPSERGEAPPTSDSPRRLVLGTAGHVDHGKTRLVHALTGVDTDRLAEEKERGITIDLGFARLAGAAGTEIGIVDVPGHEAFVRNMIAGATGMDAALLVVAADEGVMPQTREHASILDLLGVTRGVVALTKTDLVGEEWLGLVRDDVASLLEGTGLADAEIVAVSAASGEGIPALAEALASLATAPGAPTAGPGFRLPVDRVFTVRGTGTVVTGTVADGVLEDGAAARLLPSGREVRVRGLETHGSAVSQVSVGQRAAVALAGLDRADAGRGHTLVTGSAWRAHGTWTVRLRVLSDASRPLRARQRVRVHVGTDEIMARVVVLDGAEVAPGDETWAQLRLERPGVARAGDRFVLRSYSPITTIAGGTVVEPLASKRRRLDGAQRALLESLLAGGATSLRARLALAAEQGVDAETLPVEVPGVWPASDEAIRVGDRFVAPAALATTMEVLLGAVDRHHAENPLSLGLDAAEARRLVPPRAAPGLGDVALSTLVARGKLEVGDGVVRRPGYAPRLGPAHLALRERVVQAYRAGGLQPTAVSDAAGPDAEDAWSIVKLLEREGTLMPMGAEAYVDADAMREAEERVRTRLGGRTGVQPAEFREVLGLSRKHLIPLLEHFDRRGVTRRERDGRTVAPPSP